MPSFDIVSKTDLAEIDNALANMVREMSQRYDFKGSQSRIERKEAEITIDADDDLKLIAGKRDMLLGKLQEHYGVLKEDAERQIDGWIAKLSAGRADGSSKNGAKH